MAFNGAFTVTLTSDPKTFILTDTSTGTDAGLTGRTVSLFKKDGTLLTGSTINWPIGNSTISISVLTIDYALRISVAWASSAPLAPPSTYVFALLYGFTGNLTAFWYQLVERMTANPDIRNRREFMKNLFTFIAYIDNVGLSVAQNDQTNAQLNINSAYFMQQNDKTYFS
jgi:hypothetical protein